MELPYTHFWRVLAGFLQVMKQLLEQHLIREMKIEPVEDSSFHDTMNESSMGNFSTSRADQSLPLQCGAGKDVHLRRL